MDTRVRPISIGDYELCIVIRGSKEDVTAVADKLDFDLRQAVTVHIQETRPDAGPKPCHGCGN